MNTKQMIALWYSGIFLILALAFLAGEKQLPPWLTVTASILILASLLIYSLGDRAEIDGKTLLKSVGAPIGGLALFILLTFGSIGLYHSIEYNANPADIGLLDPSLKFEDEAVLSGRIQNNSDVKIEEMELRIRIYSVEPGTIVLSDTLVAVSLGGELLDSLSSSRRETAKLLDGETVTWEDYEGIPPGEVESFSLREYTSMELPDTWAWSYEVVSAQ